jgi:ParB/RepB/Spo0J family partition protein
MSDTAVSPTAMQGEFRTLPLVSVHRSPTNPRDAARRKKSKKWAEFANSVKQQGVMQPIVVRPWPEHYAHTTATRPEWEIIAGEGRYDASVEAGFAEIPAMIRTQLTDKQVVELQMIENIQREDLTPLEEADGLRRMIEEHGHTVDSAAATLECSKGRIYQHLKLLSLGTAGRAYLADGDIDFATAVAIARIPVAALQDQAAREIAKTPEGHAMSNREAVRHIQERYMVSLKGCVFDIKDTTLVKAAGSCAACPKRSGNNTDPTVEVRDVNVCTDPDCYRDKKLAHNKRRMAEAQQAGHKVVTGSAAKTLLPYANPNSINAANLTALDSTNYGDGLYGAFKKNAYPTHRELLEKAQEAGVEVKITLIEHKATETLVEAVDSKALAAALAKAGVLKKPKTSSDEGGTLRDQQREAEKKARAETEFRKRVHGAIRAALDEAIAAGKASPLDWNLIAADAWRATSFDDQKYVLPLWLATEDIKKGGPHEAIRALTKRVESMQMNELYIFMIDLVLLSRCRVSTHTANPTKMPEAYATLAERYGVSVPELRKQYTAELKAKEKPAKKAEKPAKAAAKSPSTPTPAAQAQEPKAPAKAAPADKFQDTAWPFPKLPREGASTAKPAAQAPEPKAATKGNKQAAGAAKGTKKASKSAGSAGGDPTQPTTPPDAGTPAPRCDKTDDMFTAGENTGAAAEAQP